MKPVVPVVLFAYARPQHLARVLAGLRENRVPWLWVFADGAKGAADAAAVTETRTMLRAIDWCEVRLVERPQNLGLGRNVLAGVGEVAAAHEMFVVWEDDLIGVPGTYAWLCAALHRYAHEPRVMSVTAWTHERVTPAAVAGRPYFDGRAECWVWGTWARAWAGMDETAEEKLADCQRQGMAPDHFGADIPAMAAVETAKNIWAVRWLCHHLQHGGLCLRPPWSMVEHIGSDAQATNCVDSDWMRQPALRPAPPVPAVWPEPILESDLPALWRRQTRQSVTQRARTWLRRLLRGTGG
ncbi:MAG: hypothetical protein HZA93_28435 [Verrucomicrobia bacterium]|nr:hypothetical protein [Verrucomicrobiota bacterium]